MNMKHSRLVATIVILLIFFAVIFGGYMLFQRYNPSLVEKRLTTDAPLVFLFVVEFESESKLLGYLMVSNVSAKRIGVIEIPLSLAMVSQEIQAKVPLAYIYEQGGYKAYVETITQSFLLEELPYIRIQEPDFVTVIDILGGVEMFVYSELSDLFSGSLETGSDKEPVSQTREVQNSQAYIQLESENVYMDGIDVENYVASLINIPESEFSVSSKRKAFIFAVLDQLAQEPLLLEKHIRQRLYGLVDTNLSKRNFYSLLSYIQSTQSLDELYQQMSGLTRTIRLSNTEYQSFFSQREFHDTLESMHTTLKKTQQDVSPSSFTISILNGTVQNGLAGKTSEFLQSEGYSVIAVGNALVDTIKHTMVIDRTGNVARAQLLAKRIGTENLITDLAQLDRYGADVTLILGGDFDGNFVIR